MKIIDEEEEILVFLAFFGRFLVDFSWSFGFHCGGCKIAYKTRPKGSETDGNLDGNS